MLKVIGLRLTTIVPLGIVVSIVIFGLESLIPGNAAVTLLGPNATQVSIARLNRQLGLDKPWWVRYGDWLAGLVHGNLGTSIISGESVTKLLDSSLGVTLSLVGFSIVVCAVCGVALGMISGLRGGVLGRVLDVFSLSGLALPSFWVAIVLVAVVAVKGHLLPATGYVSPSVSLSGWLDSIILPVAALSFFGIAGVAKQARDATRDLLEADYIRMLRASGMAEWRVLGKHLLCGAAIPVATVLGVVSAAMLGGTVFVEDVFVLPGLGSAAASAATQHDLPVILGAGVYFTVIVVLINLAVDVAYTMLNPKVRVS